MALTWFILFCFTGEIPEATMFTIIIEISKVIFYYSFEWLWDYYHEKGA